MPESLFQYCNVIKKETLAQVFSSEFCEIFKSTYFEENLQTTASINPLLHLRSMVLLILKSKTLTIEIRIQNVIIFIFFKSIVTILDLQNFLLLPVSLIFSRNEIKGWNVSL